MKRALLIASITNPYLLKKDFASTVANRCQKIAIGTNAIAT